MSNTLESLVSEYPKIFADRYKPMTETAMCWGFDCGEGWYNILNQLCCNIQNHIDNTRRDRLNTLLFNRGLHKAINGDTKSLFNYFYQYSKNTEYALKQVNLALENFTNNGETAFRTVRQVCPQVVATQVKEKFGTLRFYYNGGDDMVDGMVRMAESMSGVTCEKCGDVAKLRGNGWLYVACDKHAGVGDEA
jgi:hypothetical protein